MIKFSKRDDIIKKVYFLETSCCTPELTRLFYSKYDPERLMITRTSFIEDSDVLIINGHTPKHVMKNIESEYDKLDNKPFIIALGGCAIQGGPLNSPITNLKVNIFIPGCPPRPEAIIHGILKVFSRT